MEQRTRHYFFGEAVVGIIIIFLSILALFQWGIVGIVLTNSIRFFIGKVSHLFWFVMMMIGIYKVIYGRQLSRRWQTYLGIACIMSAFSTLYHVNAFQMREPLMSGTIGDTFQLLWSNFLVNQSGLDVGGGMLGAFLYVVLRYLFAIQGTYLFIVISMILGLILTFSITFQTWRTISSWFKTIRYQLFPVYEYEEQILPEYVELEEEVERALEQEEQPVQSIARPSKVQKLWHQVKEVFDYDNSADRLWDDYQDDVEPMEEVEEVMASRTQRKGRVPQETTLDMEMLQPTTQEKSSSKQSNAEVVIVQPTHTALEKEKSSLKTPLDSPTQHWQSQAHEAQDLTTHELDTLLEQELDHSTTQHTPKIKAKEYVMPPKSLLKQIPPVDQSEEYARINENIQKLEHTFDSFGVKARVVKAHLGPSVTKYEIQPAVGVKVSKIVSLSDDIALALAARDVRMEAPIPGKSLIGIEVPNHQVSPVSFWEIIDAALESPNVLEVPLGRDISGTVCLADLSKMPHLLIAGATGSGKSVGMNVIIVSLLMKAKPDEVKFLMIDPKKVELTLYDDIPHLLAPVVTNPRKAAQALNKVVQEMERRYELFASTGVRNIDSYNEQIERYNQKEQTGYERLPKIVVFVDELADLMMVASNEVENAITRLAQMARAAGIHMIIATQRPSVDVITGIIKANVPSRLAFAVSSGIDSRTILDSNGAEKLLGRGDMLFQPMGKNKPIRVQGAYISDSEVEKITDFVKAQSEAQYDEALFSLEESDDTIQGSEDELFGETVDMLEGLETISISQLQRKFRIGYNRAARLIDDLEANGYVSGQDGSKPRQVLR